MTTVVGALSVDLGMQTVRFGRDMTKSTKIMQSGTARMNRLLAMLDASWGKLNRTSALSAVNVRNFARSASLASGAVLGLLGVAGLAGLVQRVVDVNREFQSLKATLETFVGDADRAAGVFKILQEFAARTPFALQEVTAAFNRMLSVGLDPSIRALQAFGNIASGSSKTVLDFVEAAADAAVGEFERLKEFGIKARSEGDKVVFTFKGVETEVEKSAAAITAFLVELGETEFAGALDRQAKTLNGTFSNLGDGVAAFFARIGDGGLNNALVSLVRRLTSWVDANSSIADSIGRVLGSGLDRIPAILTLMGEGFEFARANSRMFLTVLGTLAALQFASVVASWAGAMIVFVRTMNLARIATLAFAAAQNISRKGLVVFAALLAIAAGRVDEFKRLVEEVAKTAENLLGPVFETVTGAASDLGARIDALTSDVKGMTDTVAVSGRTVAELDAELKKLIPDLQRTGQVASEGAKLGQQAFKGLGREAGNALTSIVVRGDDVQSVLVRLLQSLSEMIFRLTVVRQLEESIAKAGKSGGGGFLGGIGSLFTSALGLFGGGGGGLGPQFTGTGAEGLLSSGSFQHGGSFEVAGRGGTDANIVQFRATRGERVTVETPEQQRAGRGSIVINQSFDMRGAEPGVFARMQGFKEQVKEETTSAVFAAINAGGTAAQTVGRRRRR